MSAHSVDDALAESSPRFITSAATEAALDALVMESRSAGYVARSRRRRRPLWLLPTTVVTVGALTAGAFAVDQMTRLDVPIAVEYITDTGVTVSCTAHIESSLFAPRLAEITEYYTTHEFAAEGIGQRIYNYALMLTGEREGTRADLPRSVAWLPGDENTPDWEPQEARSALTESMLDFIVLDVVYELGLSGQSFGAHLGSDCTGQLH